MVLTRSISAAKSRDWSGLGLELVVVVVGIVIAFQVDRWYDDRMRRAAVLDNLSGLAADFVANRDALLDAQQRHQRAKLAIEELLLLEPGAADTLTHDEFYRHISDALEARSFSVVRRTYDSLISAGLVEIIPSEDLKTEITGFYQFVDRIEGAQQDNRDLFGTIFEPYIARNLDYAAVMAFRHPEANRIRQLRPPEQFRDVIGSPDFEGALMMRWHISLDLLNQYSTALEQVDRIDNLILDLADRQD